jgi:hypothetical protein
MILITTLVSLLVISGIVLMLIQTERAMEIARAGLNVIKTRDYEFKLGRTIELGAKDVDGDGYWEVYAPTDSGEVPESLVGMPVVDAWGRAFKYCAWDLGTENTANSTYVSGTTAPPIENLTFRLISAGRNGVFETTCDDTAPAGDDVVYDFYQGEVKTVALGAGIGWWYSRDNNGRTDIYSRNDGYVGVKTNVPLTPLNVKGGILSGYTDYNDYPFFGLVNVSPNDGYYSSFIFNGVNYQRLYIAPGPDSGNNTTDLYFYEYSCPNNSCNIPEVHFYADTVYFHGNVVVDGTLFNNGGGWWSDRRLKSNVSPLPYSYAEKILNLTPVKFTWKNTGRKSWGFVAQDVKKVIPEAVISSPNGLEALDYETLLAATIKVVQEQQKEIEKLKRQLSSLKKKTSPKP